VGEKTLTTVWTRYYGLKWESRTKSQMRGPYIYRKKIGIYRETGASFVPSLDGGRPVHTEIWPSVHGGE
jgi:hypothetical protein